MEITKHDFKVLRRVVNNDPEVTTLDFRKRALSDAYPFVRDFMEILGAALKENTRLIEIDFSFNRLYSSISHISHGLRSNKSLRSLRLDHNIIGNMDAEVLAEALKYNTTLTYLDVRENSIWEEGAEYLLQALEMNTSLIDVQINTRLGNKYLHRLNNLLEINRNPEKYQEDYEEKIRRRLIYLNIRWTPKTHHLFPSSLQEEIKKMMILLSLQDERSGILVDIPYELWIQYVFPYLGQLERKIDKNEIASLFTEGCERP